MVPPTSCKVPRASQYSGFCLLHSVFRYGAFTLSGRLSQNRSPDLASACDSPLPRGQKPAVWALPISLAATFGIDLSFFSSAYLDVSVQRVPSAYLWIQHAVTEVRSAGFPHSEIRGSPDICSSPRLIAACHVFLRRSVPRHPPCALCHLTFWFSHFLSEVSPAAACVASQPAAIIS